ncbi:hypothetical protein GF337_05780 [candidate division KSB1 bacterium]|nr:hypothetical protein [candidate division KSB1 bacterium]
MSSEIILAVTLSFTSMSFARWNDSGFKSSPLFKHALNNAIDRLEGKVNNVSEGDKPTSKAGCSDPKAPETSDHICDTFENTCEGNYTCVNWSTCQGQGTCMSTCTNTYCGSTCEGTCATDATCEGYPTCGGNTCQATCSGQNTCDSNCPPGVSGVVYHKLAGGGWSSYWGTNSEDRLVFITNAPQYYTTFNRYTGTYSTIVFGRNSCNLTATGKIGQNLYWEIKGKPWQDWGENKIIDFKCYPEPD